MTAPIRSSSAVANAEARRVPSAMREQLKPSCERRKIARRRAEGDGDEAFFSRRRRTK